MSIERFYVHTVTVETLTGTNGVGADVFAAGVVVAGFLDESRKLVRDADGEQVVSESTFYTTPDQAALFLPDSRVTTASGVSRVIKANPNTAPGLSLPEHLAVTLT